MTPNALLTPGPAVGFGERRESANLVRCRAFRRRSLHKTHNGRSALVAGTALYAPQPDLARGEPEGLQESGEQSFAETSPNDGRAESGHPPSSCNLTGTDPK
jgi:hypothetical protein